MINYNQLYREIGIEYSTDFRDTDHVNNYGAEKVTKHLGDFLVNNYNIEDKRGKSGYEEWDQNKKYLLGRTATKKLDDAKEINEYFKNLNCIESIEIREYYG